MQIPRHHLFPPIHQPDAKPPLLPNASSVSFFDKKPGSRSYRKHSGNGCLPQHPLLFIARTTVQDAGTAIPDRQNRLTGADLASGTRRLSEIQISFLIV